MLPVASRSLRGIPFAAFVLLLLVRPTPAETIDEPPLFVLNPGPVYKLDVSPDDTWVAAAMGGWAVGIFASDDLYKRATLLGHTDTVVEVQAHPDGQHVISASADGALRSWDVNDGTSTVVYAGTAAIDAMALEASGDFAVVGENGGAVRRVNLYDGSSEEYRAFGGTVRAIAIAPGQAAFSVGNASGLVDTYPIPRVEKLLGIDISPISALAYTPQGELVRGYDSGLISTELLGQKLHNNKIISLQARSYGMASAESLGTLHLRINPLDNLPYAVVKTGKPFTAMALEHEEPIAFTAGTEQISKWNLADAANMLDERYGYQSFSRVTYHPTEERCAGFSNHELIVRSMGTGETFVRVPAFPGYSERSLHFSHDGSRLIATLYTSIVSEERIKIFDAARSGAERFRP